MFILSDWTETVRAKYKDRLGGLFQQIEHANLVVIHIIAALELIDSTQQGLKQTETDVAPN